MRALAEDTIAGIASANGPGMRGVVRLSGPRVLDCLRAHFEFDRAVQLGPRQAARMFPARLELPPPLGPVPGDLYVWPHDRSYTKQPAAEFHTIGSPPILQAALRVLCDKEARLAEPGEFTMRAFLAGRLDLTQAEAVLGVIDASDTRQLGIALRQLAGGLTTPLEDLRDRLLELLAQLEAGLDFVEEDIQLVSPQQVGEELEWALRAIGELQLQLDQRGQATEVPRVVLVGPPNAGKSSLFNALLGDSAALVSDAVGTTRDYLTGRIDLDGMQVELVDTAGWEASDSADGIRQAAQGAAQLQRHSAALQLICVEARRAAHPIDKHLIHTASAACVVYTKCDQCSAGDRARPRQTSARTGEGIAALRAEIRRRLAQQPIAGGAVIPATASRCGESLRGAAGCLQQALQLSRDDRGEELVAVEIREALDAVGRMVGAIYTDDILDRIFSRFCIGK